MLAPADDDVLGIGTRRHGRRRIVFSRCAAPKCHRPAKSSSTRPTRQQARWRQGLLKLLCAASGSWPGQNLDLFGMGDGDTGTVMIFNPAAHAHERPLKRKRIEAGFGKQLLCLVVDRHREVFFPIAPEVQSKWSFRPCPPRAPAPRQVHNSLRVRQCPPAVSHRERHRTARPRRHDARPAPRLRP